MYYDKEVEYVLIYKVTQNNVLLEILALLKIKERSFQLLFWIIFFIILNYFCVLISKLNFKK